MHVFIFMLQALACSGAVAMEFYPLAVFSALMGIMALAMEIVDAIKGKDCMTERGRAS